MRYAVLTKQEATLSLQLVWLWELWCRYWSVCVGFLYTNTEISPLFRFNKVSRNTSSKLLTSSIVKIFNMIEKLFQMRTFKERINFINKSFPNFWRAQCCSYSSTFMSLDINFCCGWRCWASHGNAISLLVKLRIKSVPEWLLKADGLDQETCKGIAFFLVNWSSLLT